MIKINEAKQFSIQSPSNHLNTLKKPNNLFVLSVKGFLAQINIFISLNLYALVFFAL